MRLGEEDAARGGRGEGGGCRRCCREWNEGRRAALEVRGYLFSVLGRRFGGERLVLFGSKDGARHGWPASRSDLATALPPRRAGQVVHRLDIRGCANSRARRVHRVATRSPERGVPAGWTQTFPPPGLPPGTTPPPVGPFVCKFAGRGVWGHPPASASIPSLPCCPFPLLPRSGGALRGRRHPATAEASGGVSVGVVRGGSPVAPPAVRWASPGAHRRALVRGRPSGGRRGLRTKACCPSRRQCRGWWAVDSTRPLLCVTCPERGGSRR